MTHSSPALTNIVITGASSGLGAALARLYAAQGVTLGLVGRDVQRLQKVAKKCQSLGAQVEIATINVTDAHAMHEFLTDFDVRYPVDLCIANAGISAGSAGGGESIEQATRILNVNLLGVLHTVNPLLSGMKKRQNGHIAIISSIAGFRGLPTAPAYSVSKAAVRYYAQALRAQLYHDHIHVSTICPGFIKTPMTDVNPFPMPFMVTAENAAKRIKRGIEKRKKMIAFPWTLVWMARLQNILPEYVMHKIYARIPAKPSENEIKQK